MAHAATFKGIDFYVSSDEGGGGSWEDDDI